MSHGQSATVHGLRKNAVNTLLEVGCSVAETAAISGQTLQMVEHYAKQRNQSVLASAAVLKWEQGGGENEIRMFKHRPERRENASWMIIAGYR